MEKKVEKYLVVRVESLGGLCVKFPPLFFAGFPDRIVLLPGARIVFVELKDEGKKPTPLQVRVHKRLKALGFRVEVLDSKESIDEFILTL
ncbi:PDDEXK family nuclease [Bacteroides stercorirosoris]|uniref:VRR-NUC domain-containing protein n=1 Tax=Bacteroides stercorirosoris TaxID=871324 RepID=A0A1M6L570_9BACE|nr:VRR-NUC domain-containing protein [Bacteroides stercorirosoris]SHJ66351.1 VRR-NUC domain-containing protein [Bacteroides stercorirosoris]